MNRDLKQLLLYQEYDLKARQYERAIGENAKLAAALKSHYGERKKSAEDLQKALLQGKSDMRLSELMLEDMTERMRTLEAKKTRAANGVQAAAIGAEISALSGKKNAEEERQLGAMAELEERTKEARHAAAQLEDLRQKTIRQLGEIERKQRAFEEEKKDLDGKLGQIRPSIPKPLLRAYESVRNSSLLPPYVCQLEGLTCSGCHMRLAANSPVENDGGGLQIRRCESCNRIIYDGDEEIF
jgi:predicted  nucleic acid-binding Zn-ribbon protein